MYWYDKPSDSQDEPELKFFDDVYTTWDDTQVLQGKIGEFVTIARRKGEEWFVGAITNNDAREQEISLDFLPQGKSYIAEIYTDGDKSVKTRTRVRCQWYLVNAQSVLRFSLRASGGAAIRLVLDTGDNRNVRNYRKQKL